MKLTLLGAAGGICQTLALLLKLRLPIGTELALYDISPVTPGVAVDISHIATSVKAVGYAGEESLAAALKDAHMVLITAGVARKPGMTRADLFNINGNIIKNLVEKVAEVCPDACVGIVSNPVNTLVPLAAEVLRKKGVYDKRKLFGVSTLDVVRAKSFVSELKEKHAETVKVPVIGGHSGPTILPLLSQALSEGRRIEFTQEAGARFAVAVFKALLGEDCVRYAYVESKKDSGYPEFFAHRVRFGLTGVEEILPIGQLSEYEKEKLKALEEVLEADIKLGKGFVNG